MVERFISDVYAQTTINAISLFHGNSQLCKIERGRTITASEIAGYYSFNESFVEPITCEGVVRILSQKENQQSNRIQISFANNPCESVNSDYNTFVTSANTALSTIGAKPNLMMFFTKVKPLIWVDSKIGSNMVLVDKSISGRCKNVGPGNVFVVEDGKVTSKTPIAAEWQSSLKLEEAAKSVKIFAVNSKGDTSDVISYSNVSFKELSTNSIVMIHPGGPIRPNGQVSDVVIKCNTMTTNGFYNFQFLVDQDMILDSLVLNFEDLSGGRIIKKKNMYNVDESLFTVTQRDDGFKKTCVYLLYSEMNFKNPCDIGDSFLYYLSYRLPNGIRVETPKKQVFFESFRENYDESPCNCK